MWIDVDELVRILRPASTSSPPRPSSPATTRGAGRGQDRRCLRRGGSTMFGSGISPGYVNQLSVVAARDLRPRRRITVNGPPTPRSTTRRRPRSRSASAGRSTTPALPRDDRARHRGVRRGGRMVADAGYRTRRGALRRRSTPRPPRIDLGSWTIPAGCVAGVHATWQGASSVRCGSRDIRACGRRVRPWSRTGRSSRTAGSSRCGSPKPSR